MLTMIISYLHNATTLLFGVYISAAFLGIQMNRKNVRILFGFSWAVGIVYIFSFLLSGAVMVERIYPLIIHLPLILFLHLFYKYKVVLCTLSVLTAYLCCQISNWVGLAAINLTKLEWVYYSVRIAVTITVFILLTRFVSHIMAQLFLKPTKSVLSFGLIPLVYYLFDYATNVYTKLLYSGLEIVMEFLGFVLCIAFILFLILYFKQYEVSQEAEQRHYLLEIKRAQSEKEIKAIRRSAYDISILRHDMRHFLLNISSFIENGETEKARDYISEIIDATDKTATQKFCQNEIVNVILSSHENEIKNNDIDFQYNIHIPDKLPFSDIDLTAILSNGLENAIHAVLPLEPDRRHIKFDLHMKENKLLISIKNTFAERPNLQDGLPQAKENGHGFGTQSIRYVSEKLNGNCQFTVDDELFILRVIL